MPEASSRATASSLLTVYARREPTTDSVVLKYAPESKRRDVVIYADAEATQQKARIPWYYKGCPTRHRKTIILNCCLWQLVWLPPKE